MPEFIVQLIGGIGLSEGDGKAVPLTGPSAKLLCFLVLTLGKAVTRDEAATALWPDDDPAATRARLRQALHTLRSAIADTGADAESVIRSSRTHISLELDCVKADVLEFERLFSEAKSTVDHTSRIDLYRSAIALYKGPLAPELDEDWIEPQRSRFASMGRTVILNLALSLAESGDLDGATQVARRAIAEDPLSEEAHVVMMQLHAAAGNPGEVLRQYRELERAMDLQLGVSPSASTRELAEHLRNDKKFHGREIANGIRTSSSEDRSIPLRQTKSARQPLMKAQWIFGALVLLVIVGVGWNSLFGGHPVQGKPAGVGEGKLVWHWELPNGLGDISSEPRVVALDYTGNLLIAGFCKNPSTDVDFFSTRLKPEGTSLGGHWPNLYDGPGHDLDRLVDASVANRGLFAAVGESDNGKGNDRTRLSGLDIAVELINDQGDQAGLDRWNSPLNGEDRPTRACWPFVCGYTWVGGKNDDDSRFGWVVLGYHMSGIRRWVQTLFTEGVLDAKATDMTVWNGDPVVCGFVVQRVDAGVETACVAVRLRASDGHVLWSREVCRLPGRDSRPWHIAPTTQGIVVAGRSYNPKGSESGDGSDIFTVQLDYTGSLKWAHSQHTLNGSGNGERVVVADDGRVVVTGYSDRSPVSSEIVTLCYSPSGMLLWDRRYKGFNRGKNSPTALTVNGKSGDVYVAGFATRQQPVDYWGNQDMILVKYDRDGRFVWQSAYDSQAQRDFATAVCLDRQKNIIVVGQTYHDGKSHTFARKYLP